MDDILLFVVMKEHKVIDVEASWNLMIQRQFFLLEMYPEEKLVWRYRYKS